jgi:LuxR family maltose regulon positive regulatory protein
VTADEQFGAILSTKLGYAQRRARVAARPRLLNRLSEVVPHHALTLIAAPAGFGKTTLVGNWALASTFRTAWLALDEDDNDDFRFLHYLLVALYHAAPEIGKPTFNRLHAERFTLNEATIRAVLTDLLNDLARVSERLVLIMDDYDAIISARIHSSLSFLLDRLPENVTVILTCRSVPPLQLARLRARAQLAELTSADLRFTVEEAALFYNQVMALSLPPDSVAAVEARTEGWIAGMQLVALSANVNYDPV